MATEVIEGTAVEVILPERAIVLAQPGQALVTNTGTMDGPVKMLAKASAIATALAEMVEAQNLYTLIRGKKYPHVEAWMTIGRMDNVVAREAERPTKNDDGSWEAFVDLVRLSDGMVIGRASAMAGAKGDGDWTSRPDHVKRSMAVTRATSRAFRQQYSWIMTLAGYQPTPADEMPQGDPQPDQRPVGEYQEPPDRPELERRADGLVGTVAKGKPPVDLEVRQTPEGLAWGFKLMSGRKGYQALAIGSLADVLSQAAVMSDDAAGSGSPSIEGQLVTVWGRIEMVPWQRKDAKTDAMVEMPPFARIAIERMSTADWEFPQREPDTTPIWPDEAEQAAILEAEMAEAAR
jgi:hypothetical protein